LKGIPDPDPTLKVFPDPIPDRSRSKSNFFTKSKENSFRNHLEVLNNETAVLFSPIFEVFKYIMTRKCYIFGIK